jgi:hypothetical protein
VAITDHIAAVTADQIASGFLAVFNIANKATWKKVRQANPRNMNTTKAVAAGRNGVAMAATRNAMPQAQKMADST